MLKKILLALAVLIWALPALGEMIVDTAWIRRYNGAANGEDHAHSMAVDALGNVYVTGYSLGNETYFDYTTIKYRPNGDTAWVRRYNGTANAADVAHDVAVDDSGNVYVTGRSEGAGTYDDVVTVKYDSLGNQIWVQRQDGPISGYDRGYALALDRLGNVYVAGSSHGDGTSDDCITVAYAADGSELWCSRYNRVGSGQDWAFDVAVDDFGCVYVTGKSYGGGSNFDYVTLKYNANGDTAWVRTYNGPTSSEDGARAIELDVDGNVFVTGVSPGENCFDYTTVKYYPNGDTAWVRRYNGPGNSTDQACDVAVDDSGNAHVTGESYGEGTGHDYATVKYDSNGSKLWVQRYDHLGDKYDGASAITVDPLGNVYVTGRSDNGEAVADYATVRYDRSGRQLWVRRYDGTGLGYDWAHDIVLGDSNDVCITGYSRGQETGDDYCTIKYVETNRWRGDTNGDGVIDGSDIVFLINYLFKEGSTPEPAQTGDTNCTNGEIEAGDIVLLLTYLYREGPPPDCES